MSGKVFVDSNVLVYAHDRDSGAKQERAAECLRELWNSGLGRLSTQVLQEFYVSVTQKIRKPVARGIAKEIIRNYGLWVETPITPATVLRACEISEAWKIAFWDSMIVAAAEQDEALQILTEDLNQGQIIAGVKVVNPFLRKKLQP